MHGIFAKSAVRVRVPHHVGHFLSIFGSVHDYRGSTFVYREYDYGVVFFQCLCSYPPPFLMLDFGILAPLMVHTICPLSSSAEVSVMYFATNSVPAMISSTK